MPLQDVPETFREPVIQIAKGFFEDGAPSIFVAWSDSRLYVGREPVTKFRDQPGTPTNVEVLKTEPPFCS